MRLNLNVITWLGIQFRSLCDCVIMWNVIFFKNDINTVFKINKKKKKAKDFCNNDNKN